jgi:hypothetical protein
MTFEDNLRSSRKTSWILIETLKKGPTINYGNMSGGEITLLTVTTMFSIADRVTIYALCCRTILSESLYVECIENKIELVY